MTLEDLERQVNLFHPLETKDSDQLSHAFKISKRNQEQFNKNSKEYILLDKFNKELLKQIKRIRLKTTEEVVYEITKESTKDES